MQNTTINKPVILEQALRGEYTQLTNEQIDGVVRIIRQEQPFSGQNIIMGTLRSLGIKIHHQRLRDSLYHIDSFRIINHWAHIIPRHVYHVAVLKYFLDGCNKFGIPIRVRADKGGENILVKNWMENYRGLNQGSFIAGLSMHNQRIEINRSLEIFVDSWNNHSIRTEHNSTPHQLFIKGMIENGFRGMEYLDINVNEYGVDWEGPVPTENIEQVVCEDPHKVLTDEHLLELKNRINPLEDDECYGINVYNKCLRIVMELLSRAHPDLL
ncbi:21176_t:CDS:2 [Entrophospora sp. SA101]|nr:21176_t:CDS:2 [Entrophospora sp. SA101]